MLYFVKNGFSHTQPQYQQGGQDQQAQEGERGLGGALTGGLAGGFGGHQAGHGIIGAIGGALLGSFAQDKLKKHKENKMEEQQRPHSGQGQHCQKADHSQCHHGGGVYAGSSTSVGFGAYGGNH